MKQPKTQLVLNSRRRPGTSASNMYRRNLCHGSKFMEPKAIEVDTRKPNVNSEWAAQGTLLHALALGQKDMKECPKSDKWAVMFAKRTMTELVTQVFGESGPKLRVETEKECLWPDTFEYIGTADRIYSDADIALVVELKFGRNIVEGAEVNMQGRCYTVATAARLRVKHVHFVIIQPYEEDEAFRVQSCCYTEDDVEASRREIEHLMQLTDYALTPSVSACRYCAAKAHCKACQDMQKQLAKKLVQFETMPMMMRGILLNGAKLIADIYNNEWKPRAKSMLCENAASVPGYKLRPGYNRVTVEDAQKALDACWKMIAPDQDTAIKKYMEIVTVAIGSLEELAYEHMKGHMTQTEIKELLRAQLKAAGATSEKITDVSLVEDHPSKK